MEGIMETSLPSGWKTPTVDQYDGFTNPYEHVGIYVTQASLYTTKDVIMCKVFPHCSKEPHWAGSHDCVLY